MSHLVSVWAPFAEKVEVVMLADAQAAGSGNPLESGSLESFPAKAVGAGWWRAETALDPREAPYAFRLDGGEPLPDPRSQRQLWGVHGPSLQIDHGSYSWSDAGFQQRPLSAAIIYEAHVGTFSTAGSFAGMAEHLDYLVELGVSHLELMPVATFSGVRGWGYDGVDLYAPHEAYGGPEGLKRLVDACHARGLAVVLDVVYNHLGPEGNYLGQFGPYFTGAYETPWGAAVNLDGPDSGEVRRFFIDNALMWLRDYHVDALRIDAVHAFYDHSAVHFLEELASEVHDLEARLGRRLLLIAESDLNDPRVVTPREVGGAGGFGIDAQWSDDFHHSLHAAFTGERRGYYGDFGSVRDISRALEETFVYAGDYAPSRRRAHGRSAAALPQERFLGYHQNHDQVGNRAVGERLSHLVDPELYRISAGLVLLSPFVPMLFQGEEWATSAPFQYFTDHGDPDLGRAVSEGRRGEFGDFGWKPEDVPDPQALDTFRRSVLPWEEIADGEHGAVLEWYRALIRLRLGEGDLAAGVSRPEVTVRGQGADEAVLIVRRGSIVIAANLAFAPERVAEPPVHELLLASREGARIEGEGLLVPGRSLAVARMA